MQAWQSLAPCRALAQAPLLRAWQLPPAPRPFSATPSAAPHTPEEPTAPAAAGADSTATTSTPASTRPLGTTTTTRPSSATSSTDPVINDAMQRINLNLGLKTEQLVAHTVGLTQAMQRQQALRLGMLLAARRKDIREGREGRAYAEVLVSEALRKAMGRGS